jgi:hypothetical protein
MVRFINASPYSGNNLVDDPQQMLFIFKSDIAEHQLAVTFYKDLMRAIDQNIVNSVIFQQGFKWS